MRSSRADGKKLYVSAEIGGTVSVIDVWRPNRKSPRRSRSKSRASCGKAAAVGVKATRTARASLWRLDGQPGLQ